MTRRARLAAPRTRIAIVTVGDLETEILGALAAGADAYSLKTSPLDRIVAAIRTAADGGAYFDPHIAHIVMGQLGGTRPPSEIASPLTPCETEILRLIASCRGNAEIAEILFIGLGTSQRPHPRYFGKARRRRSHAGGSRWAMTRVDLT